MSRTGIWRWCGSCLVVALLAAAAVVVVPEGPVLADDCPDKVTVTEKDDDGRGERPGQLSTAIAEVCDGGKVEFSRSLTTIQLGPTITVDKTVKVEGTGQTLLSPVGAFSVTPVGHLQLSGVSLEGLGENTFGIGIRVDGVVTLEQGTVTAFMPTGIQAMPGSAVTLQRGVAITENTNWLSYRHGGPGIYNAGGTVSLEDDAAVTGNTNYACYSAAGYVQGFGFGGGIYSRDGSVTLQDGAVISDNEVVGCPELPDRGQGGGIYLDGGTLTLDDAAQVTGKQACGFGGIGSHGAAIVMNDRASVTDNHATGGTGGGIRLLSGTLTINDEATIGGNTAASNGGGVINVSGVVTLYDTSGITGNTAGVSGGGVCNSSLPGGPEPELYVHDKATITWNEPDNIAP